MHRTVSTYGAFLGKKSARLVVKVPDQKEEYCPLLQLESLTVASKGVTISSDLIAELTERGIPITFADHLGNPYALISSPALHATVATRRAQLLAYDAPAGLTFVKAVVSAKLRNQASLLRYFAKSRRGHTGDEIRKLADTIICIEKEVKELHGSNVSACRQELLTLEGNAGRNYWAGIRLLLPHIFSKREHRGATDPVNSALNYGYAILYSRVWNAILLAGLEPFAGFLHVDRSGKPSLLLDMIEEFRQFGVDRAVITLFTRRREVAVDERGFLDEKARRLIADEVTRRLESTHKFKGKDYTLNSIVQMQARSAAMFFREGGVYKPFVGRW
jgi:CRISPR-associated protein Cas1